MKDLKNELYLRLKSNDELSDLLKLLKNNELDHRDFYLKIIEIIFEGSQGLLEKIIHENHVTENRIEDQLNENDRLKKELHGLEDEADHLSNSIVEY